MSRYLKNFSPVNKILFPAPNPPSYTLQDIEQARQEQPLSKEAQRRIRDGQNKQLTCNFVWLDTSKGKVIDPAGSWYPPAPTAPTGSRDASRQSSASPATGTSDAPAPARPASFFSFASSSSSSSSQSSEYASVIPTMHFPAYLIDNQSASKLCLYAHGNGEDVGLLMFYLQSIASILSVTLLAVEYPGYGVSTGYPCEESVDLAVRAAYNFATQQLRFAPADIILFGRSIGTGPTSALASELCRMDIAPHAVILQSPYISIKALAKAMIGGLGALVFNRFDNLERVKTITCPLIILHGRKDTVIPPDHGQALFDAAVAPVKHIHLSDEGTHNVMDIYGDICVPVSNFLRSLKAESPKSRPAVALSMLETSPPHEVAAKYVGRA